MPAALCNIIVYMYVCTYIHMKVLGHSHGIINVNKLSRTHGKSVGY